MWNETLEKLRLEMQNIRSDVRSVRLDSNARFRSFETFTQRQKEIFRRQVSTKNELPQEDQKSATVELYRARLRDVGADV